jgi:acetyltransferase-like isoleucine patch superfamily enzyme
MRIVRGFNRIFWHLVFSLFNAIEIRHDVKVLGEIVEKLRSYSLVKRGAVIKNDSFVRFQSYIVNPKHLTMGSGSKLGVGAKLFLYDRLEIGDNVEIGSDLTVHTSEHRIVDPDSPLCKQGAIYEPVIIGSDIYIGSRVVILPGSIIENRVVIGAGAIVKGTLRSGAIYAGVPARKINACKSNEKS